MADAFSAVVAQDEGNQVIVNLEYSYVDTGQAAVVAVDASALQGAPVALALRRITGASQGGMSVKFLWDGATDTVAFNVPADQPVHETFEPPIRSTAGTPTGDLLVTTTGHGAGDSYSLQLELWKTSS